MAKTETRSRSRIHADDRRVVPAKGRVDRPLGGYAALLGVFWAGAAGLAAHRSTRGRGDGGVGWGDLLLLSLATHQVTTTLAKDRVTTPLRAPFIHYERSEENGELSEVREGRGLKRAVGQLVTCPYCLGPWVAGAFLGGLSAAPRATRAIAGVFGLNAASNFLHKIYDRLSG